MKTKKKVLERPEATERVLKERRGGGTPELPTSKSRITTFGAKGGHTRELGL